MLAAAHRLAVPKGSGRSTAMAGTSPTEQAIFQAALKLATPNERAAYASGACGDDQGLRAAVDALLAAHQRLESTHEAPAVAPNATVAYIPASEGPGTTIGAYKLLQQVGEGGFGIVYLAEQTEPVRRKVALKVIKPG